MGSEGPVLDAYRTLISEPPNISRRVRNGLIRAWRVTCSVDCERVQRRAEDGAIEEPDARSYQRRANGSSSGSQDFDSVLIGEALCSGDAGVVPSFSSTVGTSSGPRAPRTRRENASIAAPARSRARERFSR